MKKKILLNIILSIIIFIFITSLFLVHKFNNISIEKKSNKSTIINLENRFIDLEKNLIVAEFDKIMSDTLVFKKIIEEDLKKENNDFKFTNSKNYVTNIVENKKIYDQIRYIDKQGQEIFRVDLKNGLGIICEDKNLQDKSDRYYFKDTLNLKKDELYLSKIDLNVEHGKIELPKKSVLRTAVKVFDNNGKEKGIVVVNYKASVMMDKCVQFSRNCLSSNFLLNCESYWVLNTFDRETEFAFMYDDKKSLNFKNKYPLAWKEISNSNKEFFETDTDIFFSRTIIPFQKNKNLISTNNKICSEDKFLRLVWNIKKQNYPNIYTESIIKTSSKIFKNNFLYFILIYIISVLFTIVIYILHKRKENIKFLSEYDQVTGVYNRRIGLEKIYSLIYKSKKNYNDIFLIFVDINGLKLVNDNLGHNHGDELIKNAAKIMKNSIRQEDILLRYGGDEFLICGENKSLKTYDTIWRRILKEAEEKNDNSEFKYNISLSHGVSIIKRNDKKISIKEHIDKADKNMYSEKEKNNKTTIIIKNNQ